MQVRSSLTKVAAMMSSRVTKKAKPVIGGAEEGSKGMAAAAVRVGPAVARTVAVPASTRSRKPSMGGAIRSGSMKVMK